MRPERLVIENFGPFVGRTEINFGSLDDIFLITGKTGSGKTTIFDALCFALYGTVPGSRQGHISRLRSDYAVGGDCSVSLDFLLNNRRYRVIRSPKQEKPKKRGTGTLTVEETAELYDLTGAPIPISAKKSEADAKIRELVGLQAKEFFKIVLLPQGEFAEFLRQNTTERQQVLGKLFPMDTAIRIKELARKRSAEGAVQLREAERILEDLSRRLSVDRYGELHDQAEKTLREIKIRAAGLVRERNRLEGLLELAEAEQDAVRELAAARNAAAVLEAEAAGTARKEQRLMLSRQAQPLRHHLVLAEEKRRNLELAQAEFLRAQAEQEEARKGVEAAEARREEVLLLEGELRLLHEKRPALVQLSAEGEKLRLNREETGERKKRLAALNQQIALLRQTLREKEGEIAALRNLSDQVKEREDRWEKAKDMADRLVKLRDIAAEAEEVSAGEKAARLRLEQTRTRMAELEGRIPALRKELDRLREEQEAGERARMAACLASELKPGEPCPVCGAVEHPLPAPAEKVSSGPKGETALKERTLREAEQAMAVASVERQAQDREAEGLAKRLAELAGAVVKLRPEAEHETETVALFRTIPAPGAVSSMLEKCIAVLNAAVSARDEGRRAGGRIDALYRERDVLLAQGTEQEKEAAGTEARIRALETAAEELEERRALLIRDLPAAESLESLDRRIEDLEAEIRQGREEAEQAGRLLAAAGAREESCRLRRDEGAAQRQSAETALAEALQASPFKSAEALGEAILEGETELRMEEDIRRWKEERGHAQAVLAEAERTLEQIRAKIAAAGPGISGPPAVSAEPVPAESVPADIPELRSRLLRLEEEAAAADSERDKAAAALDALEQDERRLREETKRHEELAKRHALLNALAEDLSGKNPKKTSFDAWLLGRYLAEVAAFATRRLRRMSESRYSLLLDHAGGAYRGNTGLDLAVFDAYTGKTRPCATLSGGESFMASISLALGLADSIQSRSGGVRLDAVFIDEGFGSLDEATLDKALDILDELRDHRMVGLISHVGEMKSRIPSRIEVIKTGSGSGIRIEKDG